MMVDKAKTKRAMKQFTPKRAVLGKMGEQPLELPNFSKGKAPESDKDLANKKFIDDSITTHIGTAQAHTDYMLNTGDTSTGTYTFNGIIYADAVPLGLDVLYSAEIGINLDIGQDLDVGRDIIVGGTVDGVDIAARDHAEVHTIVSHDTTTTGAQLDTAYSHSQDNTQAHTDYLLNTGDTSTGSYAFNGQIELRSGNQLMLRPAANNYDFGIRAVGFELEIGSAGFTNPNNIELDRFGNVRLAPAGGNVGIGTASPNVKLDVFSGASATSISTSTGNNNWNEINVCSGAADATKLQLFAGNTDGNPIKIGSRTNTQVAFTVADAAKMVIDTSGRVGIGTVSPAQKLHVKAGSSGATANAASNMILEDSGTNYFSLLAPDGNLQAILFGDNSDVDVGGIYYEGDDDHMKFKVNGAHRMYIIASGNVGIGTATPLNELSFGAANAIISMDTADGSDTKSLTLAGGGTTGDTRGASITVFGSDSGALPGGIGLATSENANIILNPGTGDVDISGTGNVDTTKTRLTSIGGIAIKLTNTTGANTVQGEVVKSDAATDDAVVLAATAETHPIGVFLESGIADDAEAWVVVSGIADVKADTAGFTRADRLVTSLAAATVARATTNNAPAVAVHFQEIGHAIQSAAANALGRVVLHFL